MSSKLFSSLLCADGAPQEAGAPLSCHTRLEVCPHCDSVVAVGPLRRGEVASCSRCGHALARFQGWTPRQLLAICLTAWIMLVHVLVYPLVTLDVQGNLQSTSIWESIRFAWHAGNWVVGWMTFFTAVLLPVAELAVLTSALWCLAARAMPRMLVRMLRAVDMTRNWNMLAVFLLGVLVALIKLASIGRLQIDLGLVALGLLVTLLAVLARLDTPTLWRMAEESGLVPASHLTPQALAQAGPDWRRAFLVCHRCGMVHRRLPEAGSYPAAGQRNVQPCCVRCGAALHHRQEAGLARCTAYLLTALTFYVPANLMPIMSTSTLHNVPAEHTILSGVIDLYQNGSVGIAMVVFTASLAVPVLKFAVMGWLLLSLRCNWFGEVRNNTLLFRAMEWIGQWSMLDVFVVVLLAALVHFDGLMQVKIGPAAWSFGMMVVFTMLAAQHFDPRLLWDAYDRALEPNAAQERSWARRSWAARLCRGFSKERSSPI